MISVLTFVHRKGIYIFIIIIHFFHLCCRHKKFDKISKDKQCTDTLAAQKVYFDLTNNSRRHYVTTNVGLHHSKPYMVVLSGARSGYTAEERSAARAWDRRIGGRRLEDRQC